LVSLGMGNMKRRFCVPSVWVSVASAVPQLLRQFTPRFSWSSPGLLGELREALHSHTSSKTTPSCSPGGKIPWELFSCATPAEVSPLRQPLGIPDVSIAITPCSPQWWHACGLAEESLRGAFSAREAPPESQGRREAPNSL